MSALEKLRGYICFVGADGLSMDFGLSAADIDSATLYRLAVQNARETILVTDYSKFLTPSLYQIVDWAAISRVVTDRMPDEPWSKFLSSRNIPIVCPPTPGAGAQNA
jgi:DeoR/GlpR family transcriptional regulator of sugar metabolism